MRYITAVNPVRLLWRQCMLVLCRIRIVTLCQTADYLWSTNMFHANNSSCYSNQRKLLKTAEICTQNPQKPLITFMIRLFNILCEGLVVEKGWCVNVFKFQRWSMNLLLIHHPSPLHCFIPGLKPSFPANPSNRSIPWMVKSHHGSVC